MVSIRCKMMVKSALAEMSINYTVVELGEIAINEKLSEKRKGQLKLALKNIGLELMEEQRAKIIENIKSVVIEMVHYSDHLPTVSFPVYLSQKLDQDYTLLSNMFSTVKGISIDHFIILHKIEKIKELIIYDELNLVEIAHKLGYKSVAGLSSQFKKMTGLTPVFFKSLKNQRKSLLKDI